MTILDRFNLKGKIVLLTGGAGIYGRGLTAHLAEAGAQVIIASRNLEALEKVVAEEKQRGHQLHAVTLDQSDEKSVVALVKDIEQRFGRLDGLVNNSASRPMPNPDAPASAFEDSMRTNATGIFLMHRHFGALMARHSGGSIVNIGSIQGLVGPSLDLYKGLPMPPPPPDYFFHKGGMLQLTRYYAALLGPQNVRVNYLSPGGFQTQQPPEFIARYSAQTMLGRMAGKDDLGGSVIFLLSDASAYITAANLAVDGGYTAH